MKNINHLDPEEKKYIDSYENDEWQSIDNIEEEKKLHEQYAKNTSKKNKRINIRITERDFLSIKEKSYQEGIPYQSLISSILHKYINGALTEKTL